MMKKIKLFFFLSAALSFFVIACTAETQKNTVQSNNEGLDLLTDYDREMWSGPDGWSNEQWQWKRQLRWDRECDLLAEVEVHPLSRSHQLVQIMCVPGSYQPMHYLFLYNTDNKTSTQLAIGTPETTDRTKEIWGHLSFNKESALLAITSLSRGLGDCGIYRVFNFKTPGHLPILLEKRQRKCGKEPLPKNPPEEFFIPEKWPLVKGE